MTDAAPWGYDKWVHEEYKPKPPPIKLQWHIGPDLGEKWARSLGERLPKRVRK